MHQTYVGVVPDPADKRAFRTYSSLIHMIFLLYSYFPIVLFVACDRIGYSKAIMAWQAFVVVYIVNALYLYDQISDRDQALKVSNAREKKKN